MPKALITYVDGTTEDVHITARSMIEAERHLGTGHAGGLEGTIFSAWVKLGRPGAPAANAFDEWADTIESIERPVEDADPSLPVTSDGS